MSGAGGAPGLWARADLRSRWRSLLALALIAGVTAGLAMAALSGGRRAGTALDRLHATTHASDVIAFPSQVGNYQPDWSKLEHRPEVEAIAPWRLVFGAYDVPGLESSDEDILFTPVDERLFGEVDRPVVVEGRALDPEAADEVVVDEEAAKGYDLHVGDVLPFRPSTNVGDTAASLAKPDGPLLQLRIVGVIRTIQEFLFTPGLIWGSPALFTEHPDLLAPENAFVRLEHGSADIARFHADLDDTVGVGTPILDFHTVARRVETTTSVERVALLLLGVVVVLAGLVLVGQALARSATVIGDDARTLQAMGFTRAELVSAGLRAHVAVGAVAVLAALTTAIAASSRFPVGLSGKIDPDRALHVDWAVLLPGAVLTFALVVGGSAFVLWRLANVGPVQPRPSRNPFVAWMRQVAPVPVALGTAMAFDTGRGRRSLPVRQAFVGAVAGVLGVVAVVTVTQGLDDALSHPERAGVTWDAGVTGSVDDLTRLGVKQAAINQVASASDVEAVAVLSRGNIDANGRGVQVFTMDDARGDIDLALTSGREPRSASEVAIGRSTAQTLGVDVGDTITLGDQRHRARVVGYALFPSEVHARFDEGLWLTTRGLDTAEPLPASVTSGEFPLERIVVVRFAAGVDPERAFVDLGKAAGEGREVFPAETPPELTNLENVRTLPVFLAVFLTVLAIAAVAHVLSTSVRRRGRDIAVIRAMGMGRGGARTVISAEATVVGLVGVLVGVPVGIIVGRFGWAWISDRVPLDYVPPFAAVAVIVLIPVAVIVANLLALWPGHRAARLRPSELLRAE